MSKINYVIIKFNVKNILKAYFYLEFEYDFMIERRMANYFKDCK